MNDTKPPSVEDIINPERIAVACLNLSVENFQEVFSKMETVTAFAFLFGEIESLAIPVRYVYTGDPKGSDVFTSYNRDKNKRRRNGMAPSSKLDVEYSSQFSSMLPGGNDPIEVSTSLDIFEGTSINDMMSEERRDTLMITGFFAEREVLFNALSALNRGYFVAVVSDAISTYSERIYYQALEILSRSVEVIDTRDLMRIWG
ncbi:MAG: isochorismatase family protein [Thermoplasmataceae archaeon]